MSVGFLLALVAYHAGAVYFGMPWKLFFLGLIGSAYVFLTIVVAQMFDGLSPPGRGGKTIGVGRAILVGEIVVKIPALGLMLLTIWFLGPIIQGWIQGNASNGIKFLTLVVVMLIALGAGWTWWAVVMPRWWVWALERVANPRLLYSAAVSAQLLWPQHRRLASLNRTVWKTKRLSLREEVALKPYVEEPTAESNPNL
ncbi:hypothetical protein G8O24_23670 [Bradyrhizobium sp. INPA01-394B]|uniref:Uncharacterized protein n=1 Tax=Bradyrhizobium campsiandrae TaxID=1729892 RepID=A0ABR7UC95_9BRAD|nr:hypothetical protein [Bradyrhizobium campsiandrae]MBC9880329.1 hypothetical protein [Bradyrhizobium campsiandrae]MBC9981528.1 hypothetical protein [Bradyrhizobium campsiandrae]